MSELPHKVVIWTWQYVTDNEPSSHCATDGGKARGMYLNLSIFLINLICGTKTAIRSKLWGTWSVTALQISAQKVGMRTTTMERNGSPRFHFIISSQTGIKWVSMSNYESKITLAAFTGSARWSKYSIKWNWNVTRKSPLGCFESRKPFSSTGSKPA